MTTQQVLVVLPWINVFASSEVEGAQRVAAIQHAVNSLPWADYGDSELYRDDPTVGDNIPWDPPDTVEDATDRFHPYLGRSWLRSATAYGPAPRPYFVARRYEPNPEAPAGQTP